MHNYCTTLRTIDQNWSGYNKKLNKEKSFSFSYFKYRFLRPLIKLQWKSYRKKNFPSPWIIPQATEFYKKVLSNEMKGAEFGGGFSTAFIAPRVKSLVTIEHDEEWSKITENMLKERKLDNVDYRVIPEIKDPDKIKISELDKFDGFQVKPEFSNYFSALDDEENQSFDFIIVDGRARTECCIKAISKIKDGGMLILDNSERERYLPVFEILKEKESYTATNGLTNFTVWQF
jgi:predicted O-methyltransferase YrrM